jgi:GrpB-like predicted nucleotidyltransferase (UPF0157 family)
MRELFHIRDCDLTKLRRESERVQRLIRNIVPGASVMEVGATAVDGLIGKQDIDFVVRVPADDFPTTREALDAAFSRNNNQLSDDKFQGYLVPSEFEVAIQLTISDGPYDVFEKFLNLLRSRADLRTAYNNLKKDWNGRPMDAYRRAKAEFILSALKEGAPAKGSTPDREAGDETRLHSLWKT